MHYTLAVNVTRTTERRMSMEDVIVNVLFIVCLIALLYGVPMLLFHPITSELKRIEKRLKEIADAIKAKGKTP